MASVHMFLGFSVPCNSVGPFVPIPLQWADKQAAGVGTSSCVVTGTSNATGAATAVAAAAAAGVGGRGVVFEPKAAAAASAEVGGRGVELEPINAEGGGRCVGIEPSNRDTVSLDSMRAAVKGGGGVGLKWRGWLEPTE